VTTTGLTLPPNIATAHVDQRIRPEAANAAPCHSRENRARRPPTGQSRDVEGQNIWKPCQRNGAASRYTQMAHRHIGSFAAGAFRTGCSHDGARSQRHCRRLTLCLEPTSKRERLAIRGCLCAGLPNDLGRRVLSIVPRKRLVCAGGSELFSSCRRNSIREIGVSLSNKSLAECTSQMFQGSRSHWREQQPLTSPCERLHYFDRVALARRATD
jgi:hypothetical protein